jgi:hypothetical protein
MKGQLSLEFLFMLLLSMFASFLFLSILVKSYKGIKHLQSKNEEKLVLFQECSTYSLLLIHPYSAAQFNFASSIVKINNQTYLSIGNDKCKVLFPSNAELMEV